LLRWRLILGTVFVLVLGALVYLDYKSGKPGLYLLPVALLFALLAAGEMVRLGTRSDRQPPRWSIGLGTLLVVASNFIPHLMPNYPTNCPIGQLGWPLLTLAGVILLVALVQLVRFESAEMACANLAYSIFAITYVGLLLSFVVQLRYLGDRGWGILALASLLIVVKMSDIGAYFVGRALGRHKLAPKVSPGKTIEGFAGGLLFAVIGAWLSFEVLAPRAFHIEVAYRWWSLILYGVLLATAGVVGDLSESVLKRAAGQKDSSAWMPGFGGILDMLDSVLTAAPVAFLLLVAKWIAAADAGP